MDLELNRKDEESKVLFRQLKKKRDIADLLEVPYKTLLYHLYIRSDSKKYISFSIPKKSGGERIITAPAGGLKIIQRKLCCVLQSVHIPKPSAHGFVQNKSIVSNASKHAKKKYVFNFDIKDFFPSINFGRVRGLFLSPPYNFNHQVSTVLAQICCWNNQLPQGAPTSPIISNMICSRLDTQLQRLAKRHSCDYSRYADDITFSTTRKTFPKNIAVQIRQGELSFLQIGEELKDIVDSNGFSFNPKKSRLQSQYERQEVTGLTVNKHPNVQRKFLNQIRSMLHAWEVFGPNDAGVEYLSKHMKRHKAPFSLSQNPSINPEVYYKAVVKGKINFLRMVKGADDQTYQKFIKKLAEIDPSYMTTYQRLRVPTNHDFIYVIEDIDGSCCQGTGFLLKDIGLVTCAHVIEQQIDYVVFRGREPCSRKSIEVLWKNEELDIAILTFYNMPSFGLEPTCFKESKPGDDIVLLGFPNYSYGESYKQYKGTIAGDKRLFGIQVYEISAPIRQGNSGGPVLNSTGRVIGIASRGEADTEESSNNQNFFIPIDILLQNYKP